MKKIFALLFIVLFGAIKLYSQIIADPTTWTYKANKIKDKEYEIKIECQLKPHWHIWSMNPGGDGLLMPPSFEFKKNADITLVGKIKENGKLLKREFPGTDGMTNSYEQKVSYTQNIKVAKNTVVKGENTYQVCNEKTCLPPETKKFEIKIEDIVEAIKDTITTTQSVPQTDTTSIATTSETPTVQDTTTESTVKTVATTNNKAAVLDDVTQKPLWEILLIAFLAGLAAVTTPCIYSMVPLTVSVFTKQNNDRKEGIKKALFYAISIVLIFAILGISITAIFGSDGLYKLSTNWIANLVFFTLFVIFGLSFLGAFEITLPAKWSTAADKKSSTSSYLGIFFMALTLVIVSFSCTSAFIGGIAVWASKGGFWGPFFGFGMFGLGLGLPFAFFAMFPGYLKNLEKPGGWQNALKVTLGFIELALALKFLSNADLVKGWRLLDREIFIAIWMVLAILLGLYLLGKIKFFNDSELKKNYFDIPFLSTFRLFLAGACFTFAIYLFPGLFGAPLNGMSAFLPPMGTQAFVLGSNTNTSSSSTSSNTEEVLYEKEMKLYEPATVRSLGLHTYFDFEQAKEISKKEHKPLMLDFTGITCVNCRKMESEVWSSPEVLKLLKEDFVIVSLYCDANQVDTKIKNEDGEFVTLGQFNLNIQRTKFNSNSQPLYFYIDDKENLLAPNGYDYKSDVKAFVAHLESVKVKYKELNP